MLPLQKQARAAPHRYQLNPNEPPAARYRRSARRRTRPRSKKSSGGGAQGFYDAAGGGADTVAAISRCAVLWGDRCGLSRASRGPPQMGGGIVAFPFVPRGIDRTEAGAMGARHVTSRKDKRACIFSGCVNHFWQKIFIERKVLASSRHGSSGSALPVWCCIQRSLLAAANGMENGTGCSTVRPKTRGGVEGRADELVEVT